ncbi:MAG: trypsin-like peptidase domain-containing protein [Candidatus Limivicinus sp.]|nr:trypsin-like peptidase domain-containing protein [Candidatus Limivicinus sp.]
MSNLDRKGGSWYAPLERPRTEKKKRRPKSTWLWIGLPVLVLLLIVGTSLAFAGTGSTTPGAMPSDWSDYLENFYQSSQSDTLETSIERTVLEQPFTLPLAQPGEQELSLQELYAACADSIVGITAYPEDQDGYYWGTGVIADEAGLIVTNAHVIEGCASAEVTLYNNESYEALLVGADAVSDLALLKIDCSGLPAASFGDISSLSVGDPVAAIGNPLSEEFRSTLTNGIISAIDRGMNYNGHTMSLLQTNAAINQGNSGGALFNMYGQVVGITNMKMMSYFSSIEGIGFAIPSSTVKAVVDQLAENGEVRGRPSIGITVGAIPQEAVENYELPEGLYISAVAENSDAAAQGIREGDILLAIDGQSVSTTEEVAAIRDTKGVGDSLRFTIWRQGETFDVDVRLMDTNDIY